jgi:hypothetical protein
VINFDFGVLRAMLTDAKLAGKRIKGDPTHPFGYMFHTNEQAADKAMKIVEGWVSGQLKKEIEDHVVERAVAAGRERADAWNVCDPESLIKPDAVRAIVEAALQSGTAR